MRVIRRFWHNLCMSLSLTLMRWAGKDPDENRLEELLSKDKLSQEEAEEVKKLMADAKVIVMR